ncbi:hypothetical protein [Sphingomonas oryzagri]
MIHPSTSSWYVIDEIDLTSLIVEYADLERLCDALERTADALPELPDDAEARRLRVELEKRLPVHEARSTALFDRLFAPAPGESALASALSRIRERAAAHVVLGQDLASALQTHPSALPPSTFGFMLRNFFESCRGEIAFELLTLIHFGETRLTPAARSLLDRSLARPWPSSRRPD